MRRIGRICGGFLVLACGVPAHAGTVQADVSGWCTYTGSTSTDGGLQFAYGGQAVALSDDGLPAEATVLTCTIVSAAQGLPGEAPTLSRSITVAGPGAVAVAADTTPAWPARPVQVCVSGYAVFDPVSPVTVDIAPQCRNSTL